MRAAGAEDACAIGALHLASWKRTYRDELPGEFLDEQHEDAWAERWRGLLDEMTVMITLWVVETNERARRFYEGLGTRPDGATRQHEVATGVALREVRYRMRTS